MLDEVLVPAFAIVWDPKLVSREDYDRLVDSLKNLVKECGKSMGYDVELVLLPKETNSVDRR